MLPWNPRSSSLRLQSSSEVGQLWALALRQPTAHDERLPQTTALGETVSVYVYQVSRMSSVALSCPLVCVFPPGARNRRMVRRS